MFRKNTVMDDYDMVQNQPQTFFNTGVLHPKKLIDKL